MPWGFSHIDLHINHYSTRVFRSQVYKIKRGPGGKTHMFPGTLFTKKDTYTCVMERGYRGNIRGTRSMCNMDVVEWF